MRHFFAALTVATRTRGMGKAPLAGFLVAPSGLAHLGAAYFLGATTTVALATITTAANEYLLPAAGAQEQSTCRFHRRTQRDPEGSRQRT
jgi:hypothetical protein